MMKKNEENPSRQSQMPPPADVAPSARRVMRLANKVALATIEQQTGAPFLSLTGVATLMDATPILLMSDISRHCVNLAKDPRASLLFDGTGDHANPLTEDRVSVNGRIVKCSMEEAEVRFMARHPKAFYGSFADFNYYKMEIEDAHFVGGFGTALTIPAKVLRLSQNQIMDLQPAEADILAHMNEDHSEAIHDMAVHLLKAEPGPWQLTGLDPEGCDLSARKHQLRLDFPGHVNSPQQAHKALVELVHRARTS